MTLYQLLLYAVLTSTAKSDSQRMTAVIAAHYADTPTLNLVEAGQKSAPVCPEGGLCTK